MHAVGKILEDSRGVVADSSQAKTSFPNLRVVGFQLDQLGFTEGSPIGGAEENQDGSVRSKN